MKKQIWILTLLFAMGGCSPSEEDSATSGEPLINQKKAIGPGCYQMSIKKDTAKMEVKISGDSIFGNLVYDRYEKDGNVGTFKAVMKDTLAIGWYNFESEGLMSVRQVVFLLRDNTLAEGYGDMEMVNDTAKFRFIQTVQFETNHPFLPAECN